MLFVFCVNKSLCKRQQRLWLVRAGSETDYSLVGLLDSQPSMRCHSYVIIKSFLVMFGSGYVESEDSQLRHCDVIL